MNRSPLPRHWSPEQVIAVYEFLQQLSEHLRHQYHADFVELLGQQPTELMEPTYSEADLDPLQLPLPFDGFHDSENGYDFPF